MTKKSLILFLFFIIFAAVVSAQPKTGYGEDFWFSVGAETALYESTDYAYGGSFMLGFGTGTSIGIRTVWFFNSNHMEVFELIFFFRYYLHGLTSNSGPFLQVMGGTSLFHGYGGLSIPFDLGTFSAGLSFGWRFIFSDRWFIEPAVRAGYPFLIGAGVSAGVRF